MKILVFDNYDSFTYNLVHLIEKNVSAQVDVFRNDEISLEEVKRYDKIILSPGPGLPRESGLLMPLIEEYAATKSILGVCLGHQAIAESFGAQLINLSTVFHGVSTPIQILNVSNVEDHSGNIFSGLPNRITVGRYHSWVVSEENFPDQLEITAKDDNGYIMALRHCQYNVQGIQFHPESILTPEGDIIMKNWLKS